MNLKKKQLIIASIIGALLLFVGIGLFIANKGSIEKTLAPKHEVKNEKNTESKGKDEQVTYEGIGGLDYEIKSKDVVKFDDGRYGIVFDIVSSSLFSKKSLSTLEQAVFHKAKKESGKDIKNVVIHIIDSEGNYNSVKNGGYKGGNGLVSTITADYSEKTPNVKAKHFQSLQVPELKEREIGENEDPYAKDDGNIDAFEYDVKDLVVEGSKMTLEIVATGKSENVAKFVIGFIQVQRDLSPEIKTYALNIYSHSESINSDIPTWQYDGQMLTYEELLPIGK